MSSIGFPRDIEHGAGLGCIVMRLIEPETPYERSLATALPGGVLWRFVLWHHGRVYFTAHIAGDATPPSLALLMAYHDDMPLAWQELERAKS